MKLNELNGITDPFKSTEKMPVLFIGHGSPMNAIEENEFVSGWRTIGTYVTAMKKPPTIHDFGGFPRELFEVEYPAPGSPELANETKNIVKKSEVGLDSRWGLDHGCWSVVKHLYPNADVPVIQLSLDYFRQPQYHYDLANELSSLRNKGVLILGSGNMVHNLGMVSWDKMEVPGYGFDWAIEANEKMKKFILTNNHKALINYKLQGNAFNMAIPTPDHFLPLLYSLALKKENEKIEVFNDKAVAGSLTMTSIKIG
jgi:4,5-DOPA dioxygenase extradiol